MGEPIIPSTSHTLAALIGGKVIDTSDGQVSGDFYCIQVVSDAVISAITLDSRWTGADKLTNKLLYAGQVIILRFNSITLSSGTVILAKLAKSS